MSEINPRATLLDLVEEADLFGREGVCPVLFEDSTLPRVLVISGENAGGKSFLCKALSQFGRAAAEMEGKRLEMMLVGMQMRTASGVQKALMFGDENWESTGNISVRTALAGLKTATDRSNDHWLILDEPDIGLSEGYAAALGRRFAEFAIGLPERTLGFVVVSHSRALIRPILDAGALSARVGGDLRPIRDFLDRGDVPRSIEDLQDLSKKAGEKFRAVTRALNARREEKKSRAGESPTP